MNWGIAMADMDKDMVGLDAFFDAARQETAQLPDRLEHRILQDASQVQADWQKPLPRARPGVLQQLYDMLGGWPSIGGLAAACAAGVWLGFAPPQGLPDATQFIGTETAFFDDDSLDLAMAEEG